MFKWLDDLLRIGYAAFSMKVIGLISGTSTDGIDAALVQISGLGLEAKLRLIEYESYPYPPQLRKRLLEVARNGRVDEICHLNFYLGELFARAAIKVAAKAGVPKTEIDLIGSHGQTIHHLPDGKREKNLRIRSTLQIAEPSVIAERTGITTVADFRPRDIAAGGHGAPLTPYLHWILFHHPERPRLVVNIGGISNVTYLPAKNESSKVLAFDTGPGNMLMDGMMEQRSGRYRMDRNGATAGRGKVSDALLKRLMRHPFVRRAPPKTTGREVFGQHFVHEITRSAKRLDLQFQDLLATATAFTAQSIAFNCRRFILNKSGLPAGRARRGGRADLAEVIVGGGGTKNATLMTMLKEALAPVPVLTFEAFKLDSKAIEAMAFALLAYEAILGTPNNLPTATGARHSAVMGKIVPGWTFGLSRRTSRERPR
jgi:anhydro-N-acetylmuramic acid kinase